MKIDSIQLSEGSSFSNLSVELSDMFPSQPSRGEIFYKTGPDEGMYIYDGSVWYILANKKTIGSVLQYVPVNVAGDTMKGTLVLSGDPVNPFDAATKHYVDAHSASALTLDSVLMNGNTSSGTIVLQQTPASPADLAAGAGVTSVQITPSLFSVTESYGTGGALGYQSVTILPSAIFFGDTLSTQGNTTTIGGYLINTPSLSVGTKLTVAPDQNTSISGLVDVFYDSNSLVQASITIHDYNSSTSFTDQLSTVLTGTSVTTTDITVSGALSVGIGGDTPSTPRITTHGLVQAGAISIFPYNILNAVATYIDSSGITTDSLTTSSATFTSSQGVPPFMVNSTTPVNGMSITGNAGTATNIEGGGGNQIPFQITASRTTFIPAPTVTDTYLKYNGSTFSWAVPAASSGTGTVTSVSASGTQGVTTSVANSTTTPSITIGLGAITPTSVAAAGNVSGTTLTSTVATGTAPLTVTSTTPVTNLSIGGNAGSATKLTTARTISATGDATYSVSFDGTANVTSAITLATVNATPVTNLFQKVTVNGKGLVTATSAVSSTDITTSLGYTPVNKAGDMLTGTLTFTSGTVTGLPTPTNASDAANKSYVDGAVVTYTAGTGISISAGTISNTGVTSISGTTNQITVSTTTGDITLSLPSAVTISGTMTAGSFTGAGTGLTGTASALSIGGNASTATNIASGAALQLLYQSAASTTAFVTTPSTAGTYLQYNGTTFSWTTPSAGTGTVTSVSATGTQGVTASVATSTTTPAITIGLGAITPTSVAATGTVQGTRLISTVATGTAPLQVTSTTPVPNLSIGGSAATLTTTRSISATGDATWTVNFNGSANATGALTLATVNAAPVTNSFQKVTTNGKGLVTSTSAVTTTDITTSLGYTPINKAGDTVTGTLTFTTGTVTGLATPTNATDAATKAYVDGVAANLYIHDACYVATTTNLTATYSNGTGGVGATLTNSGTQTALVIDGITVSLNDRVLVKNQTTALQNGVYYVSNTGSATTNWVLTRATDADNSPTNEFEPGYYAFVEAGTVNISTAWVESGLGSGPNSTLVLGTDAISFTQFAGPGTYLAGTGIALSGNTFSNTGVLSIAGTTNQITASTATGAITLSLPSSVTISGTLTAGSFTGAGTGLTGTAAALSIGGNAGTATALQTPRTISATGDANYSVSFDGTANVTSSLTLTTVNASPVTSAFQKVTVNGKGLVTATSAVSSTDITTSLGYTPVNKAGDTLTGTLTFTSGTVTGLPTPTNSSDAANKSYVDTTSTYTAGTGISISSKTITNTGVTSLVAGTNIAVSGSTGAVTVSVTGTVPAANTANTLTTPRTISATGDATHSVSFDGSSDVSAPLTLATVNASTGTFASVTVNGKGLVTSAANLAGDITTSGSTATLATVNTSPVTSAFQKVTVNGKGLVTATAVVMSSDIISSLGYTPISKTGDTVTGTLTFDGTHTVTGLPTPVNNTDAVNKSYVDSVISGVQVVAAATTPTNIGIVKMIAMNAFIL